MGSAGRVTGGALGGIRKWTLLGALTCAGIVSLGATQAWGINREPAPGQSAGNCVHLDAGYENYGPTDISVQAGDNQRRITVNSNPAGTITVFKWPNPSYYNQVKYQAVSRDQYGTVTSVAPNEGLFAGIRYRTADGPGFAWLRDWKHGQRYNSPDTAVPVTVYRSDDLGLKVIAFDLVTGNSFQRQFVVRRQPGSTVKSADLAVYENFNPIGTRNPNLPLADWCLTWLSDQDAVYNGKAHAILNWWNGTDAATGKPSSVALAMGFNGADSSRQVGGDGFDPGTEEGMPTDPYNQLENAPHKLGGATRARGQTVGALTAKLKFNRNGRAFSRFTVAAASSRAEAVNTLARTRRTAFLKGLSKNARQWRSWLGQTELPKTGDGRVLQVAKRALISLRLAMVPKTGAIVASSATQGPYGEDWIRDGAFFNEALDWNGLHDEVTLHNQFYTRIQASPDNPSDLRPDGNWAEGSYGDGVDGLPIAWEIDETGFGTWTLYRHAAFLKGKEKRDYLNDAYPAIVRAADFLTSCVDPETGLQCYAHEDDNFNLTQTIHGAQTTVLALRSAIKAAALTGDTSARVDAWRTRLTELRAAIESHLFDAENQIYKTRADSSSSASFKEQGWLLWPTVIRPRTDPAMDSIARFVNQGTATALAGAKGSYETKAVLGLSYQWANPTAAQSRAMKRYISYIANEQTTRTGLIGEAWQRFANGFTAPVQDMPHVWVGILLYMSAYRVYGHEPYQFAGKGLYQSKFTRSSTKKRG